MQLYKRWRLQLSFVRPNPFSSISQDASAVIVENEILMEALKPREVRILLPGIWITIQKI